ncbi:MAG: PDZ domain-containing protein [Pirellulales bacterium]|nr:PDZ domain-containing protein [Pirellulales bacterium]
MSAASGTLCRLRYASRQCAVFSAVAALVTIAALASSPASAQHGFSGGIRGGMGGFGGTMGGFGGVAMGHPFGSSMGLVGTPGMHPYGYNYAGMPYGPNPYAGLHPLSPAGLGPYNPAIAHPYNPWGPINPGGNHPLTPLYPPNRPLTPLYPANNDYWPWWWYNNPDFGYTYQMYPFSNFWEMLGFYGHYGYYGGQQGMVVSGVHGNTLANQIGLAAGDIITSVNGQPVQNAEQFVQALREAKGPITLSVYDTRNGRTSNLNFNAEDAARYAPPGSSGNTPATEAEGTRQDVRNVESGENNVPQQ